MRLAAYCKESIQYQNLGVGFSIATKSEEDQAQVLFPNKSKNQRKRSSKCMMILSELKKICITIDVGLLRKKYFIANGLLVRHHQNESYSD